MQDKMKVVVATQLSKLFRFMLLAQTLGRCAVGESGSQPIARTWTARQELFRGRVFKVDPFSLSFL